MSWNKIATTESGQVQGRSAGTEAVTVFRGIPYGADTGGDNRWCPPQPPLQWNGVRSATDFGDVCVQNQTDTDFPMSENCLSINVWTPKTADGQQFPVLIWIHGGRFIWGTGRDPQFDGTGLARKDVVVVTFNYRLGVFGFLATPELSTESGNSASGNYGLLDQIAALRWVQHNIASFGGDPDRVTIAGQSAGAASVMALVYSPLTTGLFHRAIAESGASHPNDPSLAYLAGAYRRLPDAEREGLQYMSQHRVKSLAALRAVPATDLLEGNDANEPGDAELLPPLFRPVLDGYVFARTHTETLAQGGQQPVAMLTGTNKDEDGATPIPRLTVESYRSSVESRYGDMSDEFFRLYPAISDEEAGQMSNAAARDHSRVSTFLWAALWRSTSTTPIYTYYWSHAAPGPDAHERGAFHSAEIWYFLNSLDRSDRPWTEQDRRIADRTSDYIAQFIATGDPNVPELPRWDPFDPHAPQAMELGDLFEPIEIARPDRLAFHRRFLESRGLKR